MDHQINQGGPARTNVLVTACGAPGAVGIIQGLKHNGEHDVRVFGVDVREHAAGRPFVEGFSKVPPGRSDAFIDEIVRLCKSWSIDVVLPLSTEELVSFSQHKSEVAELSGARVSVSPPSSIVLANEKVRLFDELSKLAVPIPDYKVARTIDEFIHSCDALGVANHPICVKPSFSHGGRGFRVVDNNPDMDKMLLREKPEKASISFEEMVRVMRGVRSFPEMLVMQYLPGQEYSVDMLCSESRPIASVVRLREEIRAGISYVSVVVDNREAEAICSRICDTIPFEGPIGVQLREDSSGHLRVLEVNPRLHGSVSLSVAAGVNFPYLAVKQALGERIESRRPEIGVRMSRYWGASYYGNDGLSYTL